MQRLEINGFKSFGDRCVVDMPQGMCAVVGPNGCGKSNVVDAVRWVLGEQSARMLRGKAMEDVIFNGAAGRTPKSMAEVSLVFENNGSLTHPQFSELSEITISRRLYRSGDSEYLINKMPCRLKDIQHLLMDTGLGNRAYAIIEQGRVAALSRPSRRNAVCGWKRPPALPLQEPEKGVFAQDGAGPGKPEPPAGHHDRGRIPDEPPGAPGQKGRALQPAPRPHPGVGSEYILF